MKEDFERDVNVYLNEILNDEALMSSEYNMTTMLCAFLIAANLVGFEVDELNSIAKELSDNLLKTAMYDD